MTPARERVLETVADGESWTKTALIGASGASPSVIEGLERAGALERLEVPAPPIVLKPDPDAAPPTLSPEQAAALAQIREIDAQKFGVALLDGVTPLASLQGKVLTGGELSIMGALDAIASASHKVTVTAGGTTIADFVAHGMATRGGDTLAGYDLGERITGLRGDVFGRSPLTLWRTVLRRQPSELAFFSTWVEDPESN